MLQSWCRIGMVLFAILAVVLGTGCARKMPAYYTEGNQIHERVLQSKVAWQRIGSSEEGRQILNASFGKGEKTTLIIGGFHGDEIRGAELALRFAEYLSASPELVSTAKVVIVPVLNPDGLVRQTRFNAKGIDLNRNFPTSNWTSVARSARYNPGEQPGSEPETKLAMALIDTLQPDRIVSIHAPLEVVNYDGPARALAERMALHNGYPVSGDIGYPTPGSFGNYAGVEKNIPTITLELPPGPFEKMWEGNKKALMEAITY